MREIKFRGKNKKDDVWVYGDLITNNGKPYIVNGVIEANEEYIAIEEWCPVIPESVGQFTGFRDRITKKLPVGNKIYEGDIVKYHKTTSKWSFTMYAKVIFERGSFYYHWEREMLGKLEIHKDSMTRYEKKYLRVIGNIYDNPEMI